MDKRVIVLILMAVAIVSCLLTNQGNAVVVLPKTWVASETLKAADLNANFAALKGAIDVVQPDALPSGMVFLFDYSATLPSGYFRLEGQAVGKTTYPTLYSVIGDRYSMGTEASGSFRLPNLASVSFSFTVATGTATMTYIIKD